MVARLVFGVVEPEDSLVGHHKAADDKVEISLYQSPTQQRFMLCVRFILFGNQGLTDYKTL